MLVSDNKRDFAIYIITENSLKMLDRLTSRLLQDSQSFEIFLSEKLYLRHERTIIQRKDKPYLKILPLPMGKTIAMNFSNFHCHIFFVSIGAVIRMVKDYIVDKRKDPAIISVDDRAKFCICLLSGHIGRGNSFTNYIANILKATPVITTASEVSGTLPADILGREFGWQLYDDHHNITQAGAAIVNGYPVAFIQETGEPDFWKHPLPTHIKYFNSFKDCNPEDYEMFLIASDRLVPKRYPQFYQKGVLYQTKTLILGVGCDKNTPYEVFSESIHQFCEEHQLLLASIRVICSINLKAQEKCILKFCEKHNIEFQTYQPQVLDQTPGICNPSEIVKKYTGTRSVAEAACLQYCIDMASQDKRLLPRVKKNNLYPKRKYQIKGQRFNVTCASSRLIYRSRLTSISL